MRKLILTLLFTILMTTVTSFAQLSNEIGIIDHLDTVVGANWNADETIIMSWSEAPSVLLSDSSGNLVRELNTESGVIGATWNSDETLILIWEIDGNVTVMDADENVSGSFKHGDAVIGASWNPAETAILSYGADGLVQIWRNDGTEVGSLSFLDGVVSAAWNSDGTQVFAWAGNGEIAIASFDDAESLLTENEDRLLNPDGLLGADVSSDDSRIISWTEVAPELSVWIVANNQATPLPHSAIIADAQWDTSGTRILVRETGEIVRIWESGVEPILIGHELPVTHAMWVNDDTSFITVTADGTSYLWDSITGDLIQTFVTDVPLNGLALSLDGSQLVTFGDSSLNVWDVASGTSLTTLSHDGEVMGATWSADGATIISWGADSTVRIWDIEAVPNF